MVTHVCHPRAIMEDTAPSIQAGNTRVRAVLDTVDTNAKVCLNCPSDVLAHCKTQLQLFDLLICMMILNCRWYRYCLKFHFDKLHSWHSQQVFILHCKSKIACTKMCNLRNHTGIEWVYHNQRSHICTHVSKM